MKACMVCGSSIGSSHARALYCSGACKVTAYKKRNPDKIKEARKEYYWSDPERFRESRKEAWDGKQWYQAQSKKADRVCALFEKMNDRDRARFADWLLKVSHRACHHKLSDNWIASYNSQNI